MRNGASALSKPLELPFSKFWMKRASLPEKGGAVIGEGGIARVNELAEELVYRASALFLEEAPEIGGTNRSQLPFSKQLRERKLLPGAVWRNGYGHGRSAGKTGAIRQARDVHSPVVL